MDERREIAMEEYKTLREEILASIGAQHRILQLGFAILGIAFAATTGGGSKLAGVARLPTILLLYGIPLFAFATISMWLTEVYRMVRAGAFLRDFERRMNDDLGSAPVLTWEQDAHSHGIDIEVAHIVVVAMIVAGIAAGSLTLGWVSARGLANHAVLRLTAAAASIVLAAVVVWIAFLVATRRRTERNHSMSTASPLTTTTSSTTTTTTTTTTTSGTP